MFIIAITSIPVYNKIPLIKDLIIKYHKGPLAMPENAEFLYNKVMVLVAFIIGMLTATAQYLKYRNTGNAWFFKKDRGSYTRICSDHYFDHHFYPLSFYKHGAGFLEAVYTAFFASPFMQ